MAIRKFDEMGKITTADCVNAIVDFYKFSQNSELTNPKNWKRLSKSGSGIFIRMFQNRATNQLVEVEATESKILKVNDTFETQASAKSAPAPIVGFDLKTDFPIQEVFDCATVYLKEEPHFRPIADPITKDEMEDDGYERFKLKKGTRIGFGDENFDNGSFEFDGIIEVTKDTYYYSYEREMICDGIITFDLGNNMGYVPAQEPVDLMVTDYENIENTKEVKKLVKLYKLDHLLLSM